MRRFHIFLSSPDGRNQLYHVRLGGELVCLEAFQSHPLDGQLDSTLVVDAVVFFIINVSGQTEVGHLHRVALIQPVKDTKVGFL